MFLKMLKITEFSLKNLFFTCFYRLSVVEYNLNYITTEKGKLIEKLGRKTKDLRSYTMMAKFPLLKEQT